MEGIDLTQQVPSQTESFLIAAGIIIISCIFVFGFIFIRRYKGKFLPILIGVLGYVSFIFIAYNLLSMIIYSVPGISSMADSNVITLNVTFTIILTAMFVLARYFLVKIMLTKYDGTGNILNIGLGLGLGEAIMYAFSTLTLTVWCTWISGDGLAAIFQEFSAEEAISTYNSISMLFDSPSIVWIVLSVSAVMDMLSCAVFTIITYGVIKGKLENWWIAVSAGLNFLLLLPFKIYDSTSMESISVMSIIKISVFVAVMFIVYKLNKGALDGMLSGSGQTVKKATNMPKFGKLSNK